MMNKLKDILENKKYMYDNTLLGLEFDSLGGLPFLREALKLKTHFFDCFRYYSSVFVKQWYKTNKCLKSKHIGCHYVFKIMLGSVDYDFRYILDGCVENKVLQRILEQEFQKFFLEVLYEKMLKGSSLSYIEKRVGAVRLSRYLHNILPETTIYLKLIASQFTANRELISLRKMTIWIFGEAVRTNFAGGDKEFFELLKSIVNEEIIIQNQKFLTGNRRELISSKDIWRLYQKHGTALKQLTIDFTKVNKASMHNELKSYLNHRFSGHIRVSDRTFIFLFEAANKLCELNQNIHYFADVDFTDVKKLQLELEKNTDQTKIMTMFSACRTLYKYLCSDINESNAPKPNCNPFDSIRFVNAHKYNKATAYIPDEVITELLNNLCDLSNTYKLVFEIFSQTGMRAKEVACLEADCLKESRYDNGVGLKYIPYKTLKHRRKKGVGDYHIVYISEELAEKIKEQIILSEDLRKESNLPYIFLHIDHRKKITMLDVQYFAVKINSLIKKHSICDKDGKLWIFTTRQCRKTLVVNMINNGATVNELVYQLGHLNRSTVMKYYAEVKAIRLAELNTEFFKKEFDVLLSGEQLEAFTEEERRLLYVDFRLQKRRVEFGFCARKLCEGPCKSSSKSVHCVNCPNLCTGKKYMPYWRELLCAEQERVSSLITSYHEQNITGFEDFAEYKLACGLITAYEALVLKLSEDSLV